jgi:DnaK suppressor protein
MMDEQRARQLLADERARLERSLRDSDDEARDERSTIGDTGDLYDGAEPLTAEAGTDAIISGIEDRLAALDRADARLQAGTYGRSVLSSQPIPDERLEADPAAELTVEEEAAQNRPGL